MSLRPCASSRHLFVTLVTSQMSQGGLCGRPAQGLHGGHLGSSGEVERMAVERLTGRHCHAFLTVRNRSFLRAEDRKAAVVETPDVQCLECRGPEG